MRSASQMNRYPDPRRPTWWRRWPTATASTGLDRGGMRQRGGVRAGGLGGGGSRRRGDLPWPSFEGRTRSSPGGRCCGGADPTRRRVSAGPCSGRRAVTPATRCIFVCAQPHRHHRHHRRSAGLLDAVPPDVLVVLDGAYAGVRRRSGSRERPRPLADHPRLAVLRTFSKAYGLAGLRVGYAVAHPAIASPCARRRSRSGCRWWPDAAIASLAAEDELLARVRALQDERARVRDELQAAGWSLPDPQGNFVWLPTGDRTSEVVAALAQAGIVARAFPGVGLRNHRRRSGGERCPAGHLDALGARPMTPVGAPFGTLVPEK